MAMLPARALGQQSVPACEFAGDACLRAEDRARACAHQIDGELQILGEVPARELRVADDAPRERHAASGEQAGPAQAPAAEGAHLVVHPPSEFGESRARTAHEIERLHWASRLHAQAREALEGAGL